MANVMDDIRRAGTERRLLRMVYRKLNGEVSDRIVEPYEIREGNRFYGYDIEKDEIRHFIITGILETEILEDKYNPRWPIKIQPLVIKPVPKKAPQKGPSKKGPGNNNPPTGQNPSVPPSGITQ